MFFWSSSSGKSKNFWYTCKTILCCAYLSRNFRTKFSHHFHASMIFNHPPPPQLLPISTHRSCGQASQYYSHKRKFPKIKIKSIWHNAIMLEPEEVFSIIFSTLHNPLFCIFYAYQHPIYKCITTNNKVFIRKTNMWCVQYETWIS